MDSDMDGDSMSSDSSMSSNSTTMSMMMKPYLHFTKGDTLLFDTLAPSSAGAIFGACLIFFLLAIVHRWLLAYRRGVEEHFATRYRRLTELSSRDDNSTKHLSGSAFQGGHSDKYHHASSTFVLSHELSRGILTGLDTTFHYLLMLVVMSFNASYTISIILGSVVGEIAFGRLNQLRGGCEM